MNGYVARIDPRSPIDASPERERGDVARRRRGFGCGVILGAVRDTVLLLALVLPMAGHAASPDTPTSNGAAVTTRPPTGDGVAGRVIDRAGRPLRGIVVLVRKLDPPNVPIPELANSTDARGRFFWPLPAGRYRLTFVGDGHRLTERTVTVRGGGETVRMEVVVAGRRRD